MLLSLDEDLCQPRRDGRVPRLEAGKARLTRIGKICRRDSSRKNWLLFGLALWLGFAVGDSVPAQTRESESAGTNRYLLIVATSPSMERRLGTVLATVQSLVESGMAGQLRPGDTIGVWTFDQELHTGQLPLQYWSAEKHKEIADRISAFLRDQPYQKPSSLEPALVAMQSVVRKSKRLTIILVSDGAEKIHGTPFDEHINELYNSWYGEQERKRVPFFTVLSAREGKITDFSVNPAPWPIELPPAVSEAAPAPSGETKLEPPLPKPPPEPAPPLILSAKDSDVVHTNQGAQALQPGAQGAINQVETNLLLATQTGQVNLAHPEAHGVADSAPIDEDPIGKTESTLLATLPVLGPQPEAAIGWLPMPEVWIDSDPADPNTGATAAAPATAPPGEHIIAARESSPSLIVPSVSVGPVISSHAAEIEPNVSPQAPERTPAAATELKKAETSGVSGPFPARLPASNSVSSKGLAGAPLASARSKQPFFWLAAFLFGIAVLALVSSARRRTRPASRLSLITRSLEREEK